MSSLLTNKKEKRILLINPPYERLKGFTIESIPLGTLYIATVLHKIGYLVRVYDAETSFAFKRLAYTTVNRAESHENYIEALKNDEHSCWIEIKEVIEELRELIMKENGNIKFDRYGREYWNGEYYQKIEEDQKKPDFKRSVF